MARQRIRNETVHAENEVSFLFFPFFFLLRRPHRLRLLRHLSRLFDLFRIDSHHFSVSGLL